MNLYDDAFLYDLVHGLFAEDEIFRFFHQAAEQYGTPALELACGSGNIMIPLAEAGVEIAGIDISDTMLRACRQKAAGRGIEIKIGKGDMRSFDLGRQFPLIFIAGNSFQHLDSIGEITDCFTAVKRHLAPSGRFIVEVFNPYIPLLVREMGKRYVVGEFEDHVLTEDVAYDPATQISRINWHFWHRPTDSERTLSFTMRQFFPQELDSLFVLHGFEIEHKFGDFDRSEFDGGSAAQIVIARAVE